MSGKTFRRFKVDEPVSFASFAAGSSQILEANAYVQRQAYAEYLVALVEEFPELRAELRRLLAEES